MTATRPILVALIAAWLATATAGPSLAATWQGAPGRQVVVFGVLATPGGTDMDAKIVPVVQAQLRKLLPNHGFKLIKVKSERALAGQTVACDLGDGYLASAGLVTPLDPAGKVHLRFELTAMQVSQFQTLVVTPPDQFNFFDKSLSNGNHLLLGVGAR